MPRPPLTRRAASRKCRPQAGVVRLAGYLTVPEGGPGIVLFAHGSGSSRHSPRNRFVAAAERGGPGHAAGRPADRARRKLTGPPVSTSGCSPRGWWGTDWLGRAAHTPALPVGYFGASTGGGAALVARPSPLPASRRWCPAAAGRTWRARAARVPAPTLLIVGGHDELVLDLNRRPAAAAPREPPGDRSRRDPPVRGARRHGEVAHLARDWFISHLTP